MLADLPGTVRRVAAFMDIPLDDVLFARVVGQASRPFMLEHKHQFDEGPLRRLIAQRTGLSFDANAYKVTPGARDNPKYRLTAAHRQTLEEIWQAQVAKRFGLETYEEIRQAVRTLHQTE